jgi:hypothetical protein
LCFSKKEGGLGVRNLEIWNIIAVGKILWHVYHMPESLWVRWIHGVYTKGANWLRFNPPPMVVKIAILIYDFTIQKQASDLNRM